MRLTACYNFTAFGHPKVAKMSILDKAIQLAIISGNYGTRYSLIRFGRTFGRGV